MTPALVLAFSLLAHGPATGERGALAGDLLAPEHATHLVARLSHRTKRVYANLRYEGNNKAMRSAFDPKARKCADAEKSRALAARTAGLFVLRDAMFSQQDQPVEQPSCALMMPPNWVTAAVDGTLKGEALVPVRAPAVDDDDAWAALSTLESMFGSFQPSENLHAWSTRSLATATTDDKARIANARAAVHGLAEDVASMIARVDQGPQAVAKAGAERIAASDRAYYGGRLRHNRVIPLFVENPNQHELVDEHKGLAIDGQELHPDAIDITRAAVYGRRLADGAMAIERYDLTKPEDIGRAIAVLEQLVPEGQTRGHWVYVWVGGPLKVGRERAASATELIPGFVQALDDAKIEISRVVVFERPVFRTRDGDAEDLEAFLARAAEDGVIVGANMNTGALRKLTGWSTPSRE